MALLEYVGPAAGCICGCGTFCGLRKILCNLVCCGRRRLRLAYQDLLGESLTEATLRLAIRGRVDECCGKEKPWSHNGCREFGSGANLRCRPRRFYERAAETHAATSQALGSYLCAEDKDGCADEFDVASIFFDPLDSRSPLYEAVLPLRALYEMRKAMDINDKVLRIWPTGEEPAKQLQTSSDQFGGNSTASSSEQVAGDRDPAEQVCTCVSPAGSTTGRLSVGDSSALDLGSMFGLGSMAPFEDRVLLEDILESASSVVSEEAECDAVSVCSSWSTISTGSSGSTGTFGSSCDWVRVPESNVETLASVLSDLNSVETYSVSTPQAPIETESAAAKFADEINSIGDERQFEADDQDEWLVISSPRAT